MKSIDKLREWLSSMGLFGVQQVADGIEAEIKRDYIQLPIDADGLPIHIGDIMHWHGEQFAVCAIANGRVFYFTSKGVAALSHSSQECHHCKLRTLEDVLEDVQQMRMMIVDAADEIRELLGGDAE